ncbi:MAG: hypothetical protein ABFD54_06085 [Armatimonadota bacterium]|nr:hypothetical protein [bacterium]
MGQSLHHIWTWLAMPRHGLALAVFIIGALGIGALFLGILCSVPARFRKGIVMAVTFIGGLYLSLEFLVPYKNVHTGKYPLTEVMPTVANLEIVIGCFALLLGIWNLFQIHGKTLMKFGKDWYNSAIFFLTFFSIAILGFLRDKGVHGTPEMFSILFSGFLLSLQSTTFSLIAFYIVSAAYRAFRIRSAEAGFMMVAATIIMLALVPVGALLTAWLPETGFLSAFRLERIGYWILTSPNMAAQRAIAFGVAVGALATGLRIWLSLERGSFFDRQL